MSVKKHSFIFSSNRFNQMQAAIQKANFANKVKIKKVNEFELTLEIDDDNIKVLFYLGIEFEKTGLQKSDSIKPKKIKWKCDKCGTSKKNNYVNTYTYVKNYCDTCYLQIHLHYSLERFWKRRKNIYLRKINNVGREPPINIIEDVEPENKKVEQSIKIEAPTVKIKFTKQK